MTKKNWLRLRWKLLKEIFKILGKSEIAAKPASTPLYDSIRRPSAISAINMAINSGYLKSNAMKEACISGAGSSKWLTAIDDLKNILVTIAILQSANSEFRRNCPISI